jgi:peptidoglycan/xylan/chitin deacetylase (PgdA/CDA1 family)
MEALKMVGRIRYSYLCLVSLVIPALLGLSANRSSATEVSGFRWPDGRQGAVTLSYDDAIPAHFQSVAPALEKAGLRGTFYIQAGNPGFQQHTDQWRLVARAGHELGNHSLYHPCRKDRPGQHTWLADEYNLSDYTPKRWLDEMRMTNLVLYLIDGQTERTFGNTCCDNTVGPLDNQTSLETLIPQLFVAARGEFISRPIEPTQANFANFGHYSGDGKSFEQLRDEIETAVREGRWIFYMFHGVGQDTHSLYIEAEEHRKLLDYLATNRDRIWTAPAVDVARYIRDTKPQLETKLETDKVSVSVDGQLFTYYKFADNQKYPYFWPVNGPTSGRSVTTETSQPYPHHHSLFFGCDRVNGGNYWQEGNERGQIVSQGPEIVESSGERVVIRDRCLWRQPGAEPILHDTRDIIITAPNRDVRVIDFCIRLEPLTNIEILKTNHSLFSARMVPELSVKSGGTLINAAGQQGEKETWGVASPWCDYSGTRDGMTEGLAILQHPSNRWYPSPWFTRDYGFFSPTPMYWLENDRLNLSPDQSLTLRYRVIVHTGNSQEADIASHFATYQQTQIAP